MGAVCREPRQRSARSRISTDSVNFRFTDDFFRFFRLYPKPQSLTPFGLSDPVWAVGRDLWRVGRRSERRSRRGGG
jgi:hypothetical protein